MKHTIKEWFFATRPWGYSASIIPALIAVSYLFYLYRLGEVTQPNWWYGLLAVLGAAVWQASGNVLSDYFDYKNGVDRKETFGSSRMLVEKKFTPKEIYGLGMSLMAAGSVIGFFFLIKTYPSIHLWWVGTLAILGTYFYYLLKYRALGDLNILIIYGFLLSLGTYFVMTGMLSWNILLISSSTGFLIVNILHANNMRDIKHDRIANIKTQAMQLGIKNSIRQYEILSYGAYAIILLCVVLGILHWIALTVFTTFPMLMRNIKIIRMAEEEQPERIKTMDAATAQHLTAFGGVLVISNFIAGLIS